MSTLSKDKKTARPASQLDVKSRKTMLSKVVSAAPPQFVEKYLQISDMLNHILDNVDMYLEQKLQNIKSKSEEKTILNQYIRKFLLSI